MAIGNHTTWVVVDLHTARAVTHSGDQRRAMHFPTPAAASVALTCLVAEERAKADRNAGAYDTERYLVVEVPA